MDIQQLYSIFTSHPTVTTDTRSCPPGSIFFALRGSSFNGNAFARAALDAGCSYAVVDDASLPADPRLIVVDDVLTTLQDLAAFHRRQLGTRIVQITGTNGKTTTKELVAAVLSERHNVLFTEGNFNNHIGVPKTLLRLRADHDIAVVETGANHPGEIAFLSRIVRADCGLITNVGKAHLEGFGSFEGVIKTKGELYDDLRSRPDTFIFLDGDNEHLRRIATGLPAVTYGSEGKGFDVEGSVTACTPFLSLHWRPKGGDWQTVATHIVGAYNLTNALAAAAVGTHFGVSAEQISHALAAYQPTNNRSQLTHTEKNDLIVDAYNANPTSMRAALDNFRLISHPHKLAILGEMRELGACSADEHRSVVDQVLTCGCEEVWLVGDSFKPFADRCRHFSDVDAVIAALQTSPVKGRMVLIKGSNGTRLFLLPKYL